MFWSNTAWTTIIHAFAVAAVPKPRKRQVIESDEEEDSDMDDFIDDDEDCGSVNVSKVIKNIFRYDRTK